MVYSIQLLEQFCVSNPQVIPRWGKWLEAEIQQENGAIVNRSLSYVGAVGRNIPCGNLWQAASIMYQILDQALYDIPFLPTHMLR